MAAKLAPTGLFEFYGVEHSPTVFLTHENIMVDTTIVSLPQVLTEILKFEQRLLMSAQMAAKIILF